MKTIIVGRHNPDLGDQIERYEIVGQANITFALTAAEVVPQLAELEKEAIGKEAQCILFQNIPGSLGAALLKFRSTSSLKWGVVISVPGPRKAASEHKIEIGYDADQNRRGSHANAIVQGIKHANARAKVEVSYPEMSEDFAPTTIKVTVDQVSEFAFSHIEWLELNHSTKLSVFENKSVEDAFDKTRTAPVYGGFATCGVCWQTDTTSFGVCVHCGAPLDLSVNESRHQPEPVNVTKDQDAILKYMEVILPTGWEKDISLEEGYAAYEAYKRLKSGETTIVTKSK